MIRRIAAFTLLMGSWCAAGQEAPTADVEVLRRAMDNVSHEYTACAAYYMIVANALRLSGSDETGSEYDAVADDALQIAIVSAQVDRTEEMASKVVGARLKIEADAMMKEIEYNNANISLLNVTYIDRCKLAMEDSEAIIDDWIKRVNEKR
jgi:hypothetical protein